MARLHGPRSQIDQQPEPPSIGHDDAIPHAVPLESVPTDSTYCSSESAVTAASSRHPAGYHPSVPIALRTQPAERTVSIACLPDEV